MAFSTRGRVKSKWYSNKCSRRQQAIASRTSSCGQLPHCRTNCQTGSGSFSMKLPTSMTACQRGSVAPSAAGTPGRSELAYLIASVTDMDYSALFFPKNSSKSSRRSRKARSTSRWICCSTSSRLRFSLGRAIQQNWIACRICLSIWLGPKTSCILLALFVVRVNGFRRNHGSSPAMKAMNTVHRPTAMYRLSSFQCLFGSCRSHRRHRRIDPTAFGSGMELAEQRRASSHPSSRATGFRRSLLPERFDRRGDFRPSPRQSLPAARKSARDRW